MSTLPRTYARIIALEIVCPSCGAAVKLNHFTPREQWDPRTGRFQCARRACRRAFSLGVAIWQFPGRGARAQAPGDRVPTTAEALGLRGVVVGEKIGTGGRARGNLVSEAEDVTADPPIPPRRLVEDDAFVDIRDDEDE